MTITPDDSGDDCSKVMADNQIRRGGAVDHQGGCCGLVSQANVTLDISSKVVREVSRSTDSPKSPQNKSIYFSGT
ncbi:hypothetical protein [Deinococcus saxicola]|uniref:hypothetical protein n=1 Tax=Deinococcus saxicola TaxID=249406 RepID=UPI003D11BDF1